MQMLLDNITVYTFYIKFRQQSAECEIRQKQLFYRYPKYRSRRKYQRRIVETPNSSRRQQVSCHRQDTRIMMLLYVSLRLDL